MECLRKTYISMIPLHLCPLPTDFGVSDDRPSSPWWNPASKSVAAFLLRERGHLLSWHQLALGGVGLLVKTIQKEPLLKGHNNRKNDL